MGVTVGDGLDVGVAVVAVVVGPSPSGRGDRCRWRGVSRGGRRRGGRRRGGRRRGCLGDRRGRGCGARAGRGRRLGGGGRHARRRPRGLGALRRPSPRKRPTRVGVPGRLAGGRAKLLGDSACRCRNDESRDDQGDRGDSGEGCTTPTHHRLRCFPLPITSSRCFRRGDVNGALDPGCVHRVAGRAGLDESVGARFLRWGSRACQVSFSLKPSFRRYAQRPRGAEPSSKDVGPPHPRCSAKRGSAPEGLAPLAGPSGCDGVAEAAKAQ